VKRTRGVRSQLALGILSLAVFAQELHAVRRPRRGHEATALHFRQECILRWGRRGWPFSGPTAGLAAVGAERLSLFVRVAPIAIGRGQTHGIDLPTERAASALWAAKGRRVMHEFLRFDSNQVAVAGMARFSLQWVHGRETMVLPRFMLSNSSARSYPPHGGAAAPCSGGFGLGGPFSVSSIDGPLRTLCRRGRGCTISSVQKKIGTVFHNSRSSRTRIGNSWTRRSAMSLVRKASQPPARAAATWKASRRPRL
jgi:hypothetical protein